MSTAAKLLVDELLGAVNTAGLIRAFRPQFCHLLAAEFGPWWRR